MDKRVYTRCLWLVLFFCSIHAKAQTIRNLPGLDSITIYEQSGPVFSNTFGANSTEMTTRLSGPLSVSNRDFSGASQEHYDVFYSDVNGNFDIDGDYISIECRFDQNFAGGGLNLSGIELNFSNAPSIFGCQVGSFVSLGSNGIPSSVVNGVDGNLSTTTTMGNTFGTTQRLRVTVGGFPCGNQIPTLSDWGFIMLGLIILCLGALAIWKAKFKSQIHIN